MATGDNPISPRFDYTGTSLVGLEVQATGTVWLVIRLPDNSLVRVQFSGVDRSERLLGAAGRLFERCQRRGGICIRDFLVTKSGRPNRRQLRLRLDDEWFALEFSTVFETRIADEGVYPSTQPLHGGYDGAALIDLDVVWPNEVWLLLRLAETVDGERPRVRVHFVGLRNWSGLMADFDRIRETCCQGEVRYPLFRIDTSSDRTRRRTEFALGLMGRVYRGEYRGLVETILPPEQGRVPRLTSTHTCQQCRKPLHDSLTGEPIVLGRVRGMASCRACGDPTSVFAVHFFCTSCGTFLESPEARMGSHEDCPDCGQSIRVPHDLLQRPDDPTRPDVPGFVIECPSCETSWFAGTRDVDRWTVCRGCHGAFTIPRAGNAATSMRSEHVDVERRCPHCREHVPVAARSCPYCGQNVRS